MQFCYEDKMPLRILDEGEFWKQQESEHTVVIRELVSNLEKPFVEALEAWEQALARTQAVFVRYIETVVRSGKWVGAEIDHQIMELVQFALTQSEQFISLLNQLGSESEALKQNPTAIVVLNHIRRESEYFIGIALAVLSSKG
ncbi:DUF2935 domain-containing protein [Brevibacillus humidisoli]|uniref:DUF2935 domain-containing protein n=1 Tax=Brevibacillus humidisoli TaxID=2895522 RepID=UPI001E5DBABD|nr:DUF2935 domain-containing protein [Brevibacillus humidisoli]UFJ39270.1 DUF2935 domain-containing protein [Brevibacillus humidisoli]